MSPSNFFLLFYFLDFPHMWLCSVPFEFLFLLTVHTPFFLFGFARTILVLWPEALLGERGCCLQTVESEACFSACPTQSEPPNYPHYQHHAAPCVVWIFIPISSLSTSCRTLCSMDIHNNILIINIMPHLV